MGMVMLGFWVLLQMFVRTVVWLWRMDAVDAVDGWWGRVWVIGIMWTASDILRLIKLDCLHLSRCPTTSTLGESRL